MSQYAIGRITVILDTIQELHAEARGLSDEYGIPFEITLEGGRNYNVTAEYDPGDGQWQSSSYNC